MPNIVAAQIPRTRAFQPSNTSGIATSVATADVKVPGATGNRPKPKQVASQTASLVITRSTHRQSDGRYGLRCDTLAAAGEAESFGGCCLHADALRRNRENVCDSLFHGFAMRGDFRPFADDGDIAMRDHAAQFADQRCRVVQKNMRRRPPPAFVRGRKMGADISPADRAQQCVGQRMQSRIGIGMTFQSELVRDTDTTQPDMISDRKAVHVETTSGPYIREVGTRQAFGCFEITRGREFQVHLLPLDSQYRNPRALRERY